MGFKELFGRFSAMFTKKRVPAAADRNKSVICSVLKQILPPEQKLTALEIASGSGLHAAYFAEHFPNVSWTPSEFDKSHWPSLLAYKEDHENMTDPLEVDVREKVSSWTNPPVSGSIDVMININMIHISPWEATQGLFRTAGELLTKNGFLLTYGPYAKNGQLTPESNVNFNRSLQNENSAWGIRDIADISEEGKEHGLYLAEEYDMPANNKILVFRRNNCLG